MDDIFRVQKVKQLNDLNSYLYSLVLSEQSFFLQFSRIFLGALSKPIFLSKIITFFGVFPNCEIVCLISWIRRINLWLGQCPAIFILWMVYKMICYKVGKVLPLNLFYLSVNDLVGQLSKINNFLNSWIISKMM